LLIIAWWVSRTLIRGDIPLYFEIKTALNTSSSFGNHWPLYATIMVLALYASIIYSGILLTRLNQKAAIVVYIQTPFRFIAATPSLFFAPWPISYFLTDNKQILIAGYLIIFISEAAKLVSIIPWHMKLKKSYNRVRAGLSPALPTTPSMRVRTRRFPGATEP
jgi:hypothetical protein